MSASRSTKPKAPIADSVGWMQDLQEVRHPLSVTRPLWVRHVHIESGGPLPEPSMPTPEWHPHCELSYIFQGRLIQLIGAKKIERRPGDVMLLGGGTPHYGTCLEYPLRYVTVFIAPTLLLELGPEGDGARALARFVGATQIGERVVRPPAPLSRRIAERLEQMIVESAAWGLGSELRLRALLIENLVDLLRWEQSLGRRPPPEAHQVKWPPVERALRFIHEHYARPLYVAQIAREAGTSVAHLQDAFKQALGMSCIQYLRSYRISHAAALLHNSQARVTDVALAVGFESLGHFNSSFRSLLGSSPMEYRRALNQDPA